MAPIFGKLFVNAGQFLTGRTANAVEEFATMIKSFTISAEKKDAFEAASHIAKNSGLLKELYEDKTIEGLNRYENVQELLNAIKEFVDNPENEDKNLGSFLQEIALITDADTKNDDEDSVTLMTIHGSKGLEFKNVYLVGMEEDLFPSQMMLSSRADLEEERRLFYVAITRAEHKLFLSYALTRYRFGRLKNCEPSRFLEEIDPGYIRVSKHMGSREPVGRTDYAKNFVNSMKAPVQQKPVSNQPAYKPSSDFVPSDTSQLDAGMKVEHPKFGFGVVKEMDIEGANRKAKVEFENVGEKTLLLSFAKLKIHS